MQDKNEQGGGYRACYTNVSKNVSHDLWCFCGCTTQEVHVLLYPETDTACIHTNQPTYSYFLSFTVTICFYSCLLSYLSTHLLVVKINVWVFKPKANEQKPAFILCVLSKHALIHSTNTITTSLVASVSSFSFYFSLPHLADTKFGWTLRMMCHLRHEQLKKGETRGLSTGK